MDRDRVALRYYLPPQHAFGWGIMAFSALTMTLFLRRSHFTPGEDSMFKPLHDRYPDTFATCWTIQPWVISLAIGIHALEAVALHVTKLRKHRVPTFGLVWWQWMVSAFIEGLPAFARINGIVQEEAKQQTKRTR